MGPLLPPSQNESSCNIVFHLHFSFHAQATHFHMIMIYFVRSQVHSDTCMANDDLFSTNDA